MNVYGGASELECLLNTMKCDDFTVTPLVNISPKDVTFKINANTQIQCTNQYASPGSLYDNLVSVPNARNDIADVEYGKHMNKNMYGIYPRPGNKTGSFTMGMYYKGGLVAQTKIIVHSTDYYEVWGRNIVASIEKEHPSGTSIYDIADAAPYYIHTHFTYDEIDCWGGAWIMGLLFRCNGYRIAFHHADANAWTYDFGRSSAYAGHVNCYVLGSDGKPAHGYPAQGHD